MDNSLAEIHSAFKLQGYNDPELHSLVDYIAKDGLTAKEAKDRVKEQYHLNKNELEKEYSMLVELMKAYL